MSFKRPNLQYVLLTLLIISLLCNFYITIKHSRKETKPTETKPISSMQNEKEKPHPVEPPVVIQPPITNPTVNSNPPLSSIHHDSNSTICPTRFGNFKKEEIFQQDTTRKRFSPGESSISSLPTFTPMEIIKDGESFAVLNGRLISKQMVFDLIIIIPTLSRLDKKTQEPLDYLNQTISEYYKQMKENPILEGKKLLFIIQGFVNEKEHALFHQLSEEYHHVEEFVFYVPPFRFSDPFRDIPSINYLDPNNPYPGKMARQQTCDIAFLTGFILNNFKFKYLLYTEDDFVPCPDMFLHLFNILRDLEWYYSNENTQREEFDKGICSLRIATGLGGFVLTPLATELYLKHVKDNIQFEPIDILINFVMYNREMKSTFDTCVRRGLTSYVYRKSQLKHIGGVSNWAERNDQKKFGNRIIGCFSSLESGYMWDLAEVNKFKASQRKCPKGNNLVMPCV